MIYLQTIDLITMSKILKFHKTQILTLITILKMILPIMKIHSNNKTKMKILMILSLLLKNLQFQHKMHHKQEHQHQHTLNPLEFQPEL